MQRLPRLKREIEKLIKDPPTGITCYVKENILDDWEVDIIGPPETPYAEGVFKVKVNFPDAYPFEPPMIKFMTKVYHPNVDTEGRICLDLLKMPPTGNWKPAAGIEGLLIAIRMLLMHPNPEDPLMVEIAEEFKNMKDVFEKKANEYTKKYAI